MGSAAEKLRLTSSGRDAKTGKFWAGVFAEYIGTMMFLLVAIGSILFQGDTAEDIHIALGVGLSLATSIWVTGAASGGHLNPAVSFAMLLMRKISLLKFFTYVLMQCFGAITGVAILRGVTPTGRYGTFGTTTVNEAQGVSLAQGLGTEVMITFMLVLTVFASCDGDRSDLKGSAPLSIGLAVSVGHLFAVSSVFISFLSDISIIP
jgi:aquaporin-4